MDNNKAGVQEWMNAIRKRYLDVLATMEQTLAPLESVCGYDDIPAGALGDVKRLVCTFHR